MMNNLTLLEIIFIFLFVIVLGYVIYNIASIIAMVKADANEDNDEEKEQWILLK